MIRRFKKCLITGSTGSGGSFLIEYFIKKEKNINLYGLYRSNGYLNILKKKYPNRITFLKVDLKNRKKLFSILKKIKPDLVYHLASNADVLDSFRKPWDIINNNNLITLNLLDCLRKLKKSPLIIICSTSEVYGQVKKKDVPIKETQIFNPASPYAVSKAFQDLLSQVYYKCYGLKIIITRMFSYTNPRRTNLFQSSFAKQIVDIENNKKKFLVHGNLDSIRTVMDINDAMNAYWLVAKKGKIGEIYNIGGNYIISVKNFLKKLIKESKSKIKTKQSSNLIRKADVTLQIPNLKKFKKDTGWKQKTKPRDLIKNLMDYYRL